jgi:hypothetical protein
MIWHILPINDIKPHEELSNCHCSPSSEILDNGDIMITHNSFDGREFVEQLISEIFE